MAVASLPVAAVVLGLGLAGGRGAGAQEQCPNADSGPEAGIAALTAATECLIAAERAAAGLGALAGNAALRSSAQKHAADMVARRFLSSTSPDGSVKETRATEAGYGQGDVRIVIGEAFGFGTGPQATPRAAVARWRADAGFRAVILDPQARDIGAGVALGSPRGADETAVTYVADLGRMITLATPQPGRTVGVGHVSGVVLVAPAGSRRFVRLRGKRIVPVGSRLDTKRGVARVRSASNFSGGVQRATFYSGVFRVSQRRRARASQTGAAPVTDIALTERLAPCPRRAGRSATVAARKRPRKRRVWGNGKGRFRTRGRYGSAAVVGTRWLVEDSCAGTRVTVRAGVVSVRDARTGRTRRVRAGRTVLLRAR